MADENQSTSATVPSTRTGERSSARGLLVQELKHRHDNEWKIFASATSVLPPISVLIFVIAVVALFWSGGSVPQSGSEVSSLSVHESWYFAVSGDSRDCGDLIMPKIAQAIADGNHNAPVDFYWHLGDLRAIYRVDCDIAKRANPQTKCAQEPPLDHKDLEKNDKYVAAAWPLQEDHPLVIEGSRFLLTQQNADGSWGDPDAEDVYGRYHPTWTAIDELREYMDREERLSFKSIRPFLEQCAR